MPNRIIKESICTSEEIDALSPQAEILFYRLIVKADDFGLYFGNPKIIKSMCYPLKSSDIKDNQVKTWLDELAQADLIGFYIVDDGKTYLKLTKWENHQQIRAKKSKFPMPDVKGYQMISNDCNSPRNPIQSNPIENPNRNAKTEDDAAASTPAKHKRGQYGWVKLTDEEYQRLLDEFGEDTARHYIDYVDESAEQTGNKNKWKNWNLTIRKAIKNQWGSGFSQKNNNSEKPNQASYDLNELEEMLNKGIL